VVPMVSFVALPRVVRAPENAPPMAEHAAYRGRSVYCLSLSC
jgi:hypothetical protein